MTHSINELAAGITRQIGKARASLRRIQELTNMELTTRNTCSNDLGLAPHLTDEAAVSTKRAAPSRKGPSNGGNAAWTRLFVG